MNYWIFQSVTEQQDLRSTLVEGEHDTRLASRYRQQMSEGDLVFFWLAGPDEIRGIYGWGTLLGSPELDQEKQEYRVAVRYDKRLPSRLPAEQIASAEQGSTTIALKDLLILRQPQGTNFILSREEAQAIADLIDEHHRPHIPPVPSALVESIQTGECVLFAGAGLSAPAGVPNSNEFLTGLLNLAREHQVVDPAAADSFAAALNEGDTNAVTDGLVHAFGSERSVLEDFLTKTFPDQVALAPAHDSLRKIPFAAVVTTNYDTLLEKTFPEFAEAGLYTPADADSLLDALSQRRRFILKLYGTTQRPETLIFAPIEYQAALSSNVSFSKFLEGLFFSRSFFFVGLSLEDIQDFLSGFVFRGVTPRKHFALVAVSGTAWKTKAEFLERRFNVRVLDYPVSRTFSEFGTFLETLSTSVALAPAADGTTAQPASVPVPGIRRVVLEDVGSFEKLDLDFGKDNWRILLGDNGVGKSTVLKAIAVAIIGADARTYAGRLVRAGRTRGRITVFTERNPHGYITDILTKDMLSDCDVVSIPSRCLEAEGWLALGFSPLRSVSWSASAGPQSIVQKGRPTADDLAPLLSGEPDSRMDRLKQWIVNLDAADKPRQLTLQGHRDRVSSLVFTEDGRTLISGSIDKTVRLWDSWTGRELRRYDLHPKGGINAVAVTADGKVGISGSFDHTVKSWNVETGQVIRSFEASRSQILSLSVSTKAKMLAFGSEGASIRLCSLDRNEEPKRIEGKDGEVWGVALSEDGETVVAGCEKGSIKSYEVKSGRLLHTLVARGESVWSIALAADGRKLVSGTELGSVTIWDVGSGSEVRKLQTQSAGILSVAISADGQMVAAGGEDGNVKVWDAQTGLEIFSKQAHSRGVWSVALSRDGQIVASGSEDNTIKLWSVSAADIASPQSSTIHKFFEVIAGLTDREDIEFSRVTENYRVMVKVAEAPDGVPLELLSQGLTSLLGWVGYLCQRLKETTQASDSDPLPTNAYALVLIDEIDAHMHPGWQQVLVSRLSSIFPNVQFIASTHSPLIVAGMPVDQIFRFTRDDEGRTVRVPIRDDAVMGRADQILTSSLFGLKTTVDVETQKCVDEYRGLLGKTSRTADEEKRYQELAKILQYRIPPTGETLARRAQDLLQTILLEQVGDQSPEMQEKIRERAAILWQALEASEPNRGRHRA